VTLRNTVSYAVREALESPEQPSLHFVFPASWQQRDPTEGVSEEATELLNRVEAWVHEDAESDEDTELPFALTTAVVGADEYLFSPRDYAETLLTYAREHDIDHIVLDPEYKPGARAPLLTPLSAELTLADDITYEEAPVERSVRGRRLLGREIDLRTLTTVFGLSYLFYLVIGGFAGTFDYVTGAVSAAIVSAVLSGIMFDRPVRPLRTGRTLLRWLVYVPLLLWEITKANVEVAILVLHPSLPIEPSMEKFQPAVPGSLPVTTLANSITLTPGTITVDVRGNDFYIHALTGSAREALFDGGLERAVRFVFYGREAARIATPRERGQGTGAVSTEERPAAGDGESVAGDETGEEQ
jgi:multicomponent Na+:H+ antiporter subunit E